MNKIGNKLLLTYLIILTIVFIISSIVFNIVSKKYLINEAKEQLILEGEKIVEILKKENLDKIDIRNKLRTQLQLKIVGRFIDSDMIVLNRNNVPIYLDIEDLNKKNILRIISSNNPIVNGYVVTKLPIFDIKGDTKGNIFMLARLKNINKLNKLNSFAQALSILMASIIAIIIAVFFEKSITKPIKKLKNKMQNFNFRNITEIDDIKTGDEIEELDKSFKQMANRITEYNNQKKTFFQDTSHELKTPLMSIQGYAEAIKDGIVEGEELEESLEIIINESQRLKKTVDELIYLTKLDDSKENFNMELDNFQSIIDESIKATKSLANDKKIKLILNNKFNIELSVDKDKIIRALINIISNGIRYAKASIVIDGDVDKDKIVLLIKDDGIGFPNEDEDRIFERFYKGINGNTGLGLSITKAIIEGHNGYIKAYNNIQGGATIEIGIPR